MNPNCMQQSAHKAAVGHGGQYSESSSCMTNPLSAEAQLPPALPYITAGSLVRLSSPAFPPSHDSLTPDTTCMGPIDSQAPPLPPTDSFCTPHKPPACPLRSPQTESSPLCSCTSPGRGLSRQGPPQTCPLQCPLACLTLGNQVQGHGCVGLGGTALLRHSREGCGRWQAGRRHQQGGRAQHLQGGRHHPQGVGAQHLIANRVAGRHTERRSTSKATVAAGDEGLCIA
jgi:hypothetical protein